MLTWNTLKKKAVMGTLIMLNEQKIKKLLEMAIASLGSQEDLAKKLGTTQESISRYVRGKREVPQEILYATGRCIGWDEEKVKMFLIDGYGKLDASIWQSPDRLKEELNQLDIPLLAQINEAIAKLINQKVSGGDIG